MSLHCEAVSYNQLLMLMLMLLPLFELLSDLFG